MTGEAGAQRSVGQSCLLTNTHEPFYSVCTEFHQLCCFDDLPQDCVLHCKSTPTVRNTSTEDKRVLRAADA